MWKLLISWHALAFAKKSAWELNRSSPNNTRYFIISDPFHNVPLRNAGHSFLCAISTIHELLSVAKAKSLVATKRVRINYNRAHTVRILMCHVFFFRSAIIKKSLFRKSILGRNLLLKSGSTLSSASWKINGTLFVLKSEKIKKASNVKGKKK